MQEQKIPYKANRILNLFLIGLLLILTRVWYLSVIQHEEKLKESRHPQRRSVVQQVERATIRDRFNLPLAANKIQYHAAVRYADIREIPRVIWKKDENGKSYRFLARSQHVSDLAKLLAKELNIDPLPIEDLIYGKASLFPHTPFLVKENISEKEYYRLRMLERQWRGIEAQRSYQRIYPYGRTGADIIGYLGAINQKEHQSIAQEINELHTYISLREKGEVAVLPKGFSTPLAVRKRLKELQEKAYTINDFVGKGGIEGVYDEELRGFSGKITYEVDTKGNFLRELPGTRNPIPGQRLVLTISAELQEFAESLLGHYEERKQGKDPWIKGGAIVALDPKTGEVLALASGPRFNPNDFTQKKQSEVSKWLENEAYLAEIWNGKRPLEREVYSFAKKEFYEQTEFLTWERYLDKILPADSPVKNAIQQIPNLKALHAFLKSAEQGEELILLNQILEDRDRILVIDLCRLVAKPEDFSSELLDAVGNYSLSAFRSHAQTVHSMEEGVRKQVRELYYQVEFLPWRQTKFKEFLSLKREEEREKKKYARPYTEYLDACFKEMFSNFWKEHRIAFLLGIIMQKSPENALGAYFDHLTWQESPEPISQLKEILSELGPLAEQYLKSMRKFDDLTRPLLGKYRQIRHVNGQQLEKHLAAAFYPVNGFGYTRSQAYRQTSPQGSVFKLVTSYEALVEKHQEAKEILNPLTLVDEMKAGGKILGTRENGEIIERMYKGGQLPRGHANIGKIDLLGAIEQSSNLYFSILASECIAEPGNLAQAARAFGFGEKSGIELPGEISGSVPKDLQDNKTGLYSFAIGQHSLVVTPLQTALMLAAIANKGRVLRPKVVRLIAGKERAEEAFTTKENFSFQEDLELVGIHFPLFSETEKNREETTVNIPPTEIRRSLFLPDEIRSLLLEGMDRVVTGSKGTARPSLLRGLYEQPYFLKDYVDLQGQLVGKTGTAEILYKGTIDAQTKANIRKHVWFSGISFEGPAKDPELVVVVYLRFGDAGKEAAPLAAQMVKKWREIKAKRAS